jgi:hypothetical protein
MHESALTHVNVPKTFPHLAPVATVLQQTLMTTSPVAKSLSGPVGHRRPRRRPEPGEEFRLEVTLDLVVRRRHRPGGQTQPSRPKAAMQATNDLIDVVHCSLHFGAPEAQSCLMPPGTIDSQNVSVGCHLVD